MRFGRAYNFRGRAGSRRAAGVGRRAFTMIEILIVVVILGILAAIVLPQFSNASTLTRENALKDDLGYLRTQISVYKAQHQDYPPGFRNGALAAAPADTFLAQMTQYTDLAGNWSAAPSPTFRFGPYVQKMPPNPFSGASDLKIVTSAAGLAPDDSTGWIYNPLTQAFLANSTKSDNDGTPYVRY